MRATVVAFGVDTLELWTRHPLGLEWAGRLEAARAAAVEAHEPVTLDVEGVELQLQPHGAAGARYLASGDLFALAATSRPRSPQTPTVRVEVRALALWAMGWEVAAARAVELMRALCGGPSLGALDAQVGRVDLCADVQVRGGRIGPELAREVVGRVRRASRGRHHSVDEDAGALAGEAGRIVAAAKRLALASTDEERASLVREIRGDEGRQMSVWGDELAFSGFSWGAGGPLSARLYDKTRELSVSRKQWMRTVWRRSKGFVEGEPVWRVEYQLRREGIRQLRARETEAGTDATSGSWASVRAALPALWRYLTLSWLSVRAPRTATSRATLREWWADVSRAWDGDAVAGAPEEVWRETVREAAAVTVPALAGYCASAVAQVQASRRAEGAAPLPYSAALMAALRAAHEYRAQRGETVQARAASRASALAARRWTMEGNGSRAACRAMRRAAASRAPGAERRGEPHGVPRRVAREGVADTRMEWVRHVDGGGGTIVHVAAEPSRGLHAGWAPRRS